MRVAHIALAREVTQLVHGDEGVQAAERITEALFTNQLANLSETDLQQVAQDGMPATQVNTDSLSLVEALIQSRLAVTPRGEVTPGQARKLIKGNAVSVNGKKVSDTEFELDTASAMYGRYHLVQKGKKNHHLIVMNIDGQR
jgi:tyrosyl-tRNA synthetase